MDREGKYWTERGNVGQRGYIFGRDGKYVIETGNIGQRREISATKYSRKKMGNCEASA